ncbi:MAG TPA: response regulator [Chloroflexi bacterium]|nr:response regulator [Chloroflexota bacterium]
MSDTRDTKKVLIVEDSPTQALHLQTLLENEGLEVFLAHDGRVGLQLAQELGPDLIILDVQMPEMNGFQVCRKLKNMPGTSDIPIIMFTRHDEQEAVVLGLQTGAVDYIPKDAFADAVLLETLRQMEFVG